MLNPQIKYPWIPCLVEFGPLEGGFGHRARRPAISTSRGCCRGREVTLSRGNSLDHRVDQDQGGEESGVHEGKVDEVVATHAVANTDQWAVHVFSEMVHHEEQVPWMIHP